MQKSSSAQAAMRGRSTQRAAAAARRAGEPDEAPPSKKTRRSAQPPTHTDATAGPLEGPSTPAPRGAQPQRRLTRRMQRELEEQQLAMQKEEDNKPAVAGTPPASAVTISSSGAITISSSTTAAAGGASSDGIISCFEAADTGSSRPAQPTVQCGICLESLPASSMLSAVPLLGPNTASTSAAAERCRHSFCIDCMRQYVRAEVQSRRHPLSCPDPSCNQELAVEIVEQLLADDQALSQVYQSVLLEHALDPSQRTYCPYNDCGLILERPEDSAEHRDSPVECPHCQRAFCLTCGITGWHEGFSCAEFQALPPELHSAGDAALLHTANKHKWKRCPKCGHMVQRVAGCTHMTCRCNTHFCYKCGTAFHQGRCQCGPDYHQ